MKGIASYVGKRDGLIKYLRLLYFLPVLLSAEAKKRALERTQMPQNIKIIASQE